MTTKKKEWQCHPQHCGTCNNKKCGEYKQRGQSWLEFHKNEQTFPSIGIPKHWRSYSPKYFSEIFGCASYKGKDEVI